MPSRRVRALTLPILSLALICASIGVTTWTQQPLFAAGIAMGIGLMQLADQYGKIYEQSTGVRASLMTPLAFGYHKYWSGPHPGLAKTTFALTMAGAALIVAGGCTLLVLSMLQLVS